MLRGNQGGRKISSGGSAGTSSHSQRPKSASQIWVKTRAFSMPPAARTDSRAAAMWAASGSSPASLSTAYASTVVERLAGAP